ncbi:FMN-dependent NADH-azoreductase [Vibrio sp. VB16]|uniref:FMN-dependent NADH-azoreductase n=1 Tax=Vibrio sp. VB16 TaxID=2785746 RepID=UPI00189E7AE3|nr:NAD(P)H-dependent oxidoreductase [Vibrio sp. VB16]UGA56166.1 NAD(P)H-dependent oxidoreductase [Vibrio sp. VB16]
MKVWHIDSSGRGEQSHSRRITNQFIDSLSKKKNIEISRLNVATGLPFLTDSMIQGYFTPEKERTAEQTLDLNTSNRIVESAKNADVWVIGIPIYNFSMPASFKAFFDLLIRLQETFSYGENGPIGLLENKQVYVVVTSGGTEIGADNDFLTPWLTYCLNFIGVTNVQIIKADKYTPEKDTAIQHQIEAMTQSLA